VNVRRGGLGRGLGALIPTGPEQEEATGARFEELRLEAIEPNPRQPREVFDGDALAELVTSVREVGVLQPVVVRETGPGRYQLIMGERRWRACREAGVETIPAIVRDTPDDALLRDALLENLHRQQLNPLEEAAAYEQLLQEFGVTHEELAGRLGRSRSHVSNTLRLLGLPPGVQRRVAAGVLSAGHARALLALDDDEARESLAARVVAEGLSVRAVEEIVALGEKEPTTTRQPRTRRPVAPAVAGLAERLSDVLETRVSVELGRRRGKLVVQFATIDDLERIVAQIAPAALRGAPQEVPGGVTEPSQQ
jgi:ParB family chromosome partitioning protein